MSDVAFFTHPAADPYFNMAFDEAMLVRAVASPGVRLLRLYSWRPGAITIGVNQVYEKAVRADRVGTTPVIRRVTGGRALYHDPSELTYSVAMNLEGTEWSQLAGSVSRVYENLADGLRRFVTSTGLKAEVVRRSGRSFNLSGPGGIKPCFESVARYEIVAEGRKVAASAQRQIGAAVLQHGALKLKGVVGHPALPLSGASESAPGAVGSDDFERYARLFAEAFSETWDVSIDVGDVDSALTRASRDRLEWVRKKPLDKRDTFERLGDGKGL